jgi:hypothetical protein
LAGLSLHLRVWKVDILAKTVSDLKNSEENLMVILSGNQTEKYLEIMEGLAKLHPRISFFNSKEEEVAFK